MRICGGFLYNLLLHKTQTWIQASWVNFLLWSEIYKEQFMECFKYVLWSVLSKEYKRCRRISINKSTRRSYFIRRSLGPSVTLNLRTNDFRTTSIDEACRLPASKGSLAHPRHSHARRFLTLLFCDNVKTSGQGHWLNQLPIFILTLNTNSQTKSTCVLEQSLRKKYIKTYFEHSALKFVPKGIEYPP